MRGNRRWVALVLLVLLLVVPSPVAAAQICGEVTMTPTQGWPGADLVVTGTGFTASSQIFVNFGGVQIGTATSDAIGSFSLAYTIPSDVLVGETNIFAFDAPANCEDNASYTVLATQPTTITTAPPATTTPATTTTVAPPTTAPVEPPTTVVVTTALTPPVVNSATTETPATTIVSGTTAEESPGTSAARPEPESSSNLPTLLLGVVLGAGLVVIGIYLTRPMRQAHKDSAS